MESLPLNSNIDKKNNIIIKVNKVTNIFNEYYTRLNNTKSKVKYQSKNFN